MPLTTSEIETITTLLGRSPSEVELTIFDTMWSEHCSIQKFKANFKNITNKWSKHFIGCR